MDLKEFTLNIEDTQRFNPVEETEKILRKTDDGYFQDSTNFKNENPLLSQSLKKIEKSNEKHPEHNKVKQSFEDFKNKFMAQTKINESPISYVNFLKSTCQDDSEKKRNDKDQLVPSKFFETGYKNFDSASKNPLESESENDNTEKNLVGSPIIQKSSRNYYTNAKVLRNHH